MGVARIELA